MYLKSGIRQAIRDIFAFIRKRFGYEVAIIRTDGETTIETGTNFEAKLAADVPLVPAAIAGTGNLTRLGPLRVAYGPPIELDDLGNEPSREAARVATERLMAAIDELEQSL